MDVYKINFVSLTIGAALLIYTFGFLAALGFVSLAFFIKAKGE